MRASLSRYGSHGDVEAMMGLAVAGTGRRDAGRGGAITEHAVVIAGGGPTGLMLAGEHVAIVERHANPDPPGSRTIEVLDQRGLRDRAQVCPEGRQGRDRGCIR